MAETLQTLRGAWKAPELRKKILFTLFILLIFRVGNAVPVPYVDVAALNEYFRTTLSDTVLGLYNAMSGSAFSRATVFALSITPYINSSIIMQLLCIGIPALERLQKEGGEEGRKKIASITRYVTVALALLMGFAYYTMLRNYGMLTQRGFLTGLVIVLTFTAGSAFIMWLGEQITEFGIGNGISIILFASIISRIPSAVSSAITNVIGGGMSIVAVLIILVLALALVVLIVFVNEAERRIPIQYAKQMRGRKMYGGQSTFLPIKVNMSGVMPIIFAQSIASLPATILTFVNTSNSGNVMKFFLKITDTRGWVYAVVYFLLIIGFGYFYAAVQYNPIEIANNLKKNGGFIPGFRAGRPTAEFIQKVIYKIVLFGSLYLGVIAILPIIISNFPGVPNTLAIGGTSVIIVVGVALETMRALEAQMMMRNYKGFLE
ncbi:MAG: preprotein translocase subunit SecY [Oscillospiraceae bacterium]|nr:preprotein translocase subunit SecY [Oscillospiraceae bacterium]